MIDEIKRNFQDACLTVIEEVESPRMEKHLEHTLGYLHRNDIFKKDHTLRESIHCNAKIVTA